MQSTWTLRAQGSSIGMIADEVEMRRAVELFADPDNGFELRALPTGVRRTFKGDNVEDICKAAGELPSGFGIYFTVNPIPSTLNKSAADKDVLCRRWIYFDVDPKKAEADNPSTDVEKGATSEVCDSLVGYLSDRGWPSPVVVDSGNGYGVYYRCNLPNDPLTLQTLRKLFSVLAVKFTGEKGTFDKKVHNASRVAKLPGTWARKGVQSDDRPHRPCKLVFVPEAIHSVTSQLLAETVDRDDEAKQSLPSPSINGTHTHKKGSSGASRDEAYARTAFDSECARVSLSRSPSQGGDGRNNSLFRAAAALGNFIASGLLERGEVERRLYEAACAADLHKDNAGERGILSTLQRGIDTGMQTPRAAPEDTSPRAKIGKAQQTSALLDPNEPLTVKLSKVTPLRVEWLVKDRIPKRFITIFAGRTGVGKSFVSHDLIAKLSQGQEIPFSGGECFKPGGTLILSEDSHEYVLVPRLMEAGADLTKIHAMTWKAMGAYHLGNTDMLGDAVDEVDGGVSLVMIDPPTNFLADTDEHKNSEVRQLVMKVVEWALERDLAVLFILHVNKQTGKGIEALNRVMGSVAWVTTARIAHTFCTDPETPGQCLWVPLKNNLGPLTKALAYRIAPSTEHGNAKVEWVAEVDTTADEALGHTAPKTRRDVVASEWLVERFREKREWASDDLFRAAKEAGISRNAVFEAKKLLNLPTARKRTAESGDVLYTWWVPDNWEPLTEQRDTGTPNEQDDAP